MIFELTGKSALVTGAGSGIGAAIAETFARAGARVFATDVQIAAATETAERITSAGGTATALALDVRDEAGCAEIARQTGPLDILVNNAGIGHVGTALTTTGADLDRLYAVNVRGMLNVTKAYLPEMVARRKGVIVNMASVAGLVGIQDRLAYATTKFAVVGLTKCMALDHAADGVRINCICPGRVETPWVSARVKEYPIPSARIARWQPRRRWVEWGSPRRLRPPPSTSRAMRRRSLPAPPLPSTEDGRGKNRTRPRPDIYPSGFGFGPQEVVPWMPVS